MAGTFVDTDTFYENLMRKVMDDSTEATRKNFFTVVLNPSDYWHDDFQRPYLIENPPLVHTSLGELSRLGWVCRVDTRWIPGYSVGRLRIMFMDPKNHQRQLLFKFSTKTHINTIEKVLAFIWENKLVPTLSHVRQTVVEPETTLPNPTIFPENSRVDFTKLDELTVLRAFNEARPKPKKSLNSNWSRLSPLDKLVALNPDLQE